MKLLNYPIGLPSIRKAGEPLLGVGKNYLCFLGAKGAFVNQLFCEGERDCASCHSNISGSPHRMPTRFPVES